MSFLVRAGAGTALLATALFACSSVRDGHGEAVSKPIRLETSSSALIKEGVSALTGASAALTSAAGTQEHPAVAFGEGIYLSVWADSRAAGTALYSARFLPDGQALDPVGVPITPTGRGGAFGFDRASEATKLSVAHAAGGFIVTWLTPAVDNYDLYALRFKVDVATHTLTPVESEPRFVAHIPDNNYKMAANENDFFVVYDSRDPLGGWNLAGVLVQGPSRTSSDPIGSPVRISEKPANHAGGMVYSSQPHVASDGANFLVIYNFNDGPGGGGRRVLLDGTGKVVAEPLVLESWVDYHGQFGFFGDKYVSLNIESWNNGRLMLGEFAKDGTPLKTIEGLAANDGGRLPIGQGFETAFAAVSDANAVWFLLRKQFPGESSDAKKSDCVMRFSSVFDATCVDLPKGSYGNFSDDWSNTRRGDRSLAVGPTNQFYAFTTESGLRAANVMKAIGGLDGTADAGVVSATDLVGSGDSQGDVTLSYDGSGMLAAWIDDWGPDVDGFSLGVRGHGTKVMAASVDSNGVRTGVPVALSEATNVTIRGTHSTFDGASHFVVWLEMENRSNPSDAARSRLVGRSVTLTNGAVTLGPIVKIEDVESTPFGYPDALLQPKVAWDGVDRLVIWAKTIPALPYQSTPFVGEIFGRRVTKGDTLVGTESIVLSDGTFTVAQGTPDVACDESAAQCVAVWSRSEGNFRQLRAVTIARGESKPRGAAYYLQKTVGIQYFPRIATNNRGVGLVVFTDYGSSGKPVVNAKFFNFAEPEKTDAEARALSLGSQGGDERAPTVAYMNDDATFSVVWNTAVAGGVIDVVGVSVALDGRLLDKTPVAIAADPAAVEDIAVVVSAGKGKAIVAYGRLDLSAGEGGLRLQLANISPGKFKGEQCTSNDDCATRFCAGEVGSRVCCNEACADTACGVCNAPGSVGTCIPRPLEDGGPRACGADNASRCVASSSACPTTCASVSDCADGAECRSDSDASASYCAFVPSVCFDEVSVRLPDGGASLCPDHLKCQSGACPANCRSADDCAGGLVCSFDDGKCVPAPAIENDEGSPTGCSSGAAGSSTRLGAFGVLGLLAAVARRRKRSFTNR